MSLFDKESDFSCCVVKFELDDTVEWCPTKWLVGSDLCRWPRKSKDVHVFRNNNIDPQENWVSYEIAVLGTYGDKITAIRKADLATYKSSLSSAEEQTTMKRKSAPSASVLCEINKKRRRRNIIHDSDEESSSEVTDCDDAIPRPPEIGPSSSNVKKKISKVGLSSLHNADNSAAAPTVPCIRPSLPLPSLFVAKPINNSGVRTDTRNNDTAIMAMDDFTFRKTVLRCFAGLQDDLKEIPARVAEICAANARQRQEPPIPFSFPLQGLDEFRAFESWLEKTENRAQILQKAKSKGGNAPKDVVRNVLGWLLSKPLTASLNWIGGSSKTAFKSTAIRGVLFDCCPTKANEAEMKEAAIKYLKGGPSRAANCLKN